MSFLNTGLKDGQDGYELVHTTSLPRGGGAYSARPVVESRTSRPRTNRTARSATSSIQRHVSGFQRRHQAHRLDVKHGKGVDVLIHEMALSVETWVNHMAGLYKGDLGYREAYAEMQAVQDNSHTPEEQLGKQNTLCEGANLKLPLRPALTHCHFNQDTFIVGG